MATIPKKTIESLIKTIGKFQKVLSVAKDRDVNESDTVSIVTDMLAEVFDYDKYLELTSEFAVKGIGLDLKENHLRQAVDYGANKLYSG